MSRSLAWIGGTFLVLWALITVARHARAPEDEPSARATDRAGAERLRSFWAAYNEATAARLAGELARAEERYRAALALDPEHQDSLFYLAVCLRGRGRTDEAVAVLRRLTELHPENSRAWVALGEALSEPAPGAAPSWEEAARAFARAEAMNPEHSGPFVRQGRLELERGRLEEAWRAFDVAARAGAPEGLFLAGFARWLAGDDDGAIPYFVRVLEANAREKELSGRGIPSEGDIGERETEELTPMESAGLRALVFLDWTARRRGGYPESVPPRFRRREDAADAPRRFVAVPLPATPPVRRGRWIDADGDGRPELVLATEGGLRLLRRGADAWVDATERLGAPPGAPAWDVVVLDADGDGRDDLYVLGSGFGAAGPNRLLRNVGGRFEDVTAGSGLEGARPTTAAVALDLDERGGLALVEAGDALGGASPLRAFCRVEQAFRPCGERLGLSFPTHAVDVVAGDLDGDGREDLYVAGWKEPGRLFVRTDTGFRDGTAAAGLLGVGGDGYDALVFDADGDGDRDLLVTAHAPLDRSLLRFVDPKARASRFSSHLLANDGRGRFRDATAGSGLDRAYGIVEAAAADLDGDGAADLVLALGGLAATHWEPSVALRNEAGRFVEIAYLPGRRRPARCRGVDLADADGDGRVDVFLAGAGLFRNVGGGP